MTNWHSSTIAKFKKYTLEQLVYVRADSLAAAKAGDGWNPKAGQYWDEYHYVGMELRARGYGASEQSKVKGV